MKNEVVENHDQETEEELSNFAMVYEDNRVNK